MPDAERDIISMTGIDKSFPGVHALQNVDFSVAKGEIHALVGENGAGKSTLIKILTGVDRADTGTIELDGGIVTVRSPLQAQELGISTVYQEVNLCPNLTVAENLLIGRQPSRFGVGIDWKRLNAQARECLKALGVEIEDRKSVV
jgi:galactofuranose transport system ATP-binding protein